MISPRGSWTLRRPHTEDVSPLRAWSAADQLLLDHLGPVDGHTGGLGRTLIVNDEFGAVCVGLGDAEVTVWTDSALSRRGINDNRAANGQDPLGDRSLTGDQLPQGLFDTVLVRVPKTAALLDYQLFAVAHCCGPSTQIVGFAMARHIHRSTTEAFETRLGSTATSRAVRKARLIHVTPDSGLVGPKAKALDGGAAATSFAEFVTDQGLRVVELPGTFSAGHVDVGSALLLETLRESEPPGVGATVLDLGCGNGVLGASAALQWPDTHLTLVDVSDLAVTAARETCERNGVAADRLTVHVADGLGHIATDSVDVVVTNPPFHQGHALDADMTDRLLADTARVLKPDGAAYVVVQRHLNLHTRTKRWFSTTEVRSKHPSHVVMVLSPASGA